jgi:hypothetical protein
VWDNLFMLNSLFLYLKRYAGWWTRGLFVEGPWPWKAEKHSLANVRTLSLLFYFFPNDFMEQQVCRDFRMGLPINRRNHVWTARDFSGGRVFLGLWVRGRYDRRKAIDKRPSATNKVFCEIVKSFCDSCGHHQVGFRVTVMLLNTYLRITCNDIPVLLEYTVACSV